MVVVGRAIGECDGMIGLGRHGAFHLGGGWLEDK